MRDKAVERLGDAVAHRALSTEQAVEGTILYDAKNDRCVVAE